jgi:hypothetical protein
MCCADHLTVCEAQLLSQHLIAILGSSLLLAVRDFMTTAATAAALVLSMYVSALLDAVSHTAVSR